MLRKIRLYGQLATFVGKRVLKADVATAAEAVRFLVANWPEIEKHMSNQHYRVSVGTYDLDENELHDPAGQQEIRITPVLAGAGAAGRIIAGIALVALSFIPGFAAWAGPTAYALISGVGASLLLGGVAQLLTPVPKTSQGAGSDNDPKKTFNFSGIQQTSRQGVPVPCVFGLTLVGSVVISAGTDTVQVMV
jgi:predicted phage tail protein